MNLAADANVLLSALIGGRAKLVLNHSQIGEIFTTEQNLAEVEEYAPVLARKKRPPSDIVLLALAALPVTLVKRNQYARSMAEARRRISRPRRCRITCTCPSLASPDLVTRQRF